MALSKLWLGIWQWNMGWTMGACSTLTTGDLIAGSWIRIGISAMKMMNQAMRAA